MKLPLQAACVGVWLWAVATASAAVVGIDYGLDFTKAAVVAPNTPFEIVLTPDSARKDASGILFKQQPGDDSIERIYGTPGLGGVTKFPQSAWYATKSLLGRDSMDPVVDLYRMMHPGVELAATNRSTVEFVLGENSYPVEEVVAMGLSELGNRATALVRSRQVASRAEARDVAVAVPGFWGQAQRRALLDALDLSGLRTVALVDDGVAVALNYATQPFAESGLVAVYDMGAGSATCTLLRINAGTEISVEVLGFGADPLLGGHALTALVREMLIERLNKQHPKVDARTPRIMNRLWREAERAKMVLSANQDVRIHVEGIAGDADLVTRLTRQEYESAANYQVESVRNPLLESLNLLNGTQIEITDVDTVVLAGGATRTPFVLDQLRAVAGDDRLSRSVNADEAAAQGAALRGVGVTGFYRSRPLNVIERTPLAYSVVAGDSNIELFTRGSAIDSAVTVQIPTNAESLDLLEAGATSVERTVDRWALSNVPSAVSSLSEPGPLRCVSDPSVNATFRLTVDHTVKLLGAEAWCTAQGSNSTSPTTKKTRKIITKPVGLPDTVQALNATQKQTLRRHLASLDSADAERKRRGELHNSLESLFYRLRDLLPSTEPLLAELAHVVENGHGTVAELEQRLVEALHLKSRAESADPDTDTESSDVETTDAVTDSASQVTSQATKSKTAQTSSTTALKQTTSSSEEDEIAHSEL